MSTDSLPQPTRFNIPTTPATALRLIQKANDAGAVHTFVQTNQALTPAGLKLLWEPDLQLPGQLAMTLTLAPDGTWSVDLSVPEPASE
jgi:hydrogenase maturation factor